MNDFLNKLFNLPQGSPGIKEALGILSQDRVNKKQKSIADDYNIDYIPTKYGSTDSWQRLQEWFNQAQRERANDIDSTPTQQELDYGAPPVEIAPQVQLQEEPILAQPQVSGVSSYVRPVLESYPGIENFANDWYASKGHPDAGERASLLAREALEAGLDPYMALALGAQEGGWLKKASPYAPNNYLGFGETDSGSMNMGEATFEDWLNKYLPESFMQPIYGETPYGERTSVKEWGGPDSPYKYRYNYNQSWVDAITSLLAQQENFRQSQYQDLPASIIGY